MAEIPQASCLGAVSAWDPYAATVAAVQAAIGAPEAPADFDDLQRFDSPTGCAGLCRVEGTRLHIIAVVAKRPHMGAFRTFMRVAKTEFDAIYVWEVWNPWLGAVLDRYGFHPTRRVEPSGVVSGFVWRNALLHGERDDG